MNREVPQSSADGPVTRDARAACRRRDHLSGYTTIRAAFAGVSMALLLVGCATAPPARSVAVEQRPGVIQAIDQVAPRQVSALTGMIVGGVLGTANNGAENRNVGLALGALGGAWAIRTSAQMASAPGFVVTVRMDDGAVGRFEHRTLADIRVGQRVTVDGDRLVTGQTVQTAQAVPTAQSARTGTP
jgi:outer membrane lipoprotein SlyB